MGGHMEESANLAFGLDTDEASNTLLLQLQGILLIICLGLILTW